MKTKILLIATAFFMALNLQAQAPEKFNYQGIARDNTGAALANQALGIKISILHNSTVDYSETHSVTTNNFGLYTLIIGDGTPVFGGMASVDWDSGNKFVKVEIDPAGGTNYTDLGTTELLSVPYALYALESASSSGSNPTGAAGGDLSGNYPNPNIANNAVTSTKIANGAVKTADLANDAVTAPKIADMGATTGQVLKFDGTDWGPDTDDSGAAGWELSGNVAGPTDFIGTTNDEALRFKVSNTEAGFITVFGGSAAPNTAFGNQALHNLTTGSTNTAIGSQVLANNNTGSGNTAMGNVAMYANTSGSNNTAIGRTALRFNTSGDFNTAVGSDAMTANTTGNKNSAFGQGALESNTNGVENAAFGHEALRENTTGSYNVAVGHNALQDNTVVSGNTAIGRNAMMAYSGTTGFNNTAIGKESEVSDNIIGAMALGENATVTTSDHIVLGSIFTTQIGGYASWTNLSDIRFKKDVRPQEHGLDFIMKLEPITYHVDTQKLFEFQNSVRENKIEQTPQMAERLRKKASEQESGFSAQQVEATAQAVGYDFSGVNPPENNRSHYTLEYASFVVPLVKAVQEQQATIEKMQKTIEKMQLKLEAMEQK